MPIQNNRQIIDLCIHIVPVEPSHFLTRTRQKESIGAEYDGWCPPPQVVQLTVACHA